MANKKMRGIVLSALAALTLGTTVKAQTVTNTEEKILNRFHFKGDLRLRYESKETYYKDGTDTTNKYTYHNRYRLRLVAAVDLPQNLKIDVGMRSGYANPTSGNQTFLDNKALSNYFWESLRFNILDIAYKNGDSTLKVGRHPYMIYRPIKSQLIWDNDLSFNGVSYNYENDSRIINAGINQPTYAEQINARNTINLFFAQYVQKIKLENSQLNLGTAIYYYDGVKGNTPIYNTNKGTGMGNTLVNGMFKNDYNILEAFGELKFKNVFGKPLAFAAGLAYNSAASDKNFGYDLAVKIGKAKKVHDDNFGGGTAAKGHAIRAKYKFGKNTYLAATLFYNTLYAGKKDAKPEADYERVQLDAIIKF